MAKRLILILILAGCRHTLTNEEIIREVELCKSHGMTAREYSDGMGFETVLIQCRPSRECAPSASVNLHGS